MNTPQPVPFKAEGPQPLLREIPPGAPYPVEALGPLRAAVRDTIGATQAPPAIAGASALSLAALAVQAHANVETLAGLRPVSLFALTIARSGERKSTVDSALSNALRVFEARESKAHVDAHAAWSSQWAIWDAARRSLITAVTKAASDRDKRTVAETELAALGVEPAAPMAPGRTVSEPTFEGIARALREGCPSLGVFSDEGAQFLGGFAMSPDNRQKTLAALNLLWDGAPIKRTRAGEGVYTLHGRRMALHLLAQPHAAHALLADPLAGDLGFLARCLICEPASTIGARMQASAREPGPGLAQFSHRLFEVLDSPLPMDEKTRALEPRTLTLAPEARALLRQYADHVEAAQRKGGEFEHVTAAASKSAEQACRIAGVMALWADLHAPVVTGETMADAITLAQFYLVEASRLADAATVSVEIERAERLRCWLLESWPHPEILPRDVLRLAPIRALRESPAARKALEVLASHGWLEALPEGAEVRGVARKMAYRIVRPGREV